MSEKRRDNKGRLLRTGESQRSDGSYQYRYTDIRKKRQYAYAPSLESLREKEAVIQKSIRDGLDYSAGEITVIELVDRYLETKQGVRYNTKVNHNFVKNILKSEDFCYRKISSIKISEAKQWFIKLNHDGRRYSSLQSIRGVVKPAFDMAVEDDILNKNPFAFTLTDVIPNDTEERKPLTLEETERFLAYVQGDKCRARYYDEIIILLGTGLRISELYGLTISDVDFQNRKLRVERQLTRTRNCEYYIEKTKTESGVRSIPLINDSVLHAFENVIANRKAPPVEIVVDSITGFLFLDKDGKPKVAGHLEHAMKRIVNNYNASHTDQLKVTPHVLRHTFCTNMARAGMPPKELQYLMGHNDAGTTFGIYTHMDYDAAEKALSRILENGHF